MRKFQLLAYRTSITRAKFGGIREKSTSLAKFANRVEIFKLNRWEKENLRLFELKIYSIVSIYRFVLELYQGFKGVEWEGGGGGKGDPVTFLHKLFFWSLRVKHSVEVDMTIWRVPFV